MARRHPPFVPKTAQEHPGRRIEIWVQDEARVGQQGTLTRRWGLTGSRPTAVQQTEYEWVYLFGAVNPRTGDSSALLAPLANTEHMNHHLRFISELAGPEVQIILVLDRAGWHLTRALQVPVYMLSLPHVEGPWQRLKFEGRIVYGDTIMDVPASKIDTRSRIRFERRS